MPIHGIVSTYFGDLEYDIGKSLTWTKWFCDDVYAMDINISDGSRQYVLDWNQLNTDVKYSFYSKSFFDSTTTAATWRKTSYERAKAAWGYQSNDWVLFIDGTEGFNVFHNPSTRYELSEVEIDGGAHTATITTSTVHNIEIGNTVKLVGATTVSVPEQSSGSFTHTQGAIDLADTWDVEHNLNGEPLVVSYDVYNVDEESVGVSISIDYVDNDNLIVSFVSIDPSTGEPYIPLVPIDVYGTITVATSDIAEQLLELDGLYLVTDVPDNTSFVIENSDIIETLYAVPFRNRYLRDENGNILLGEDDEPIERTDQPEVWVSTEPTGYFEGDIFQSWINYEIDNAGDADFISLDGWALVRSGSPTALELKSDRYELQSVGAIATTCEEYYISMGSFIRLARVSALDAADDSFWLKLDQPQDPSVDVYAAENLSLISYAYARWAENPTSMTQSVDSDAPNYVDGTNLEPPLRPVDIDSDVGFAMRRLISQVRPLSGLPVDPADWGDADPDGTQPLSGDYKKLDQFYVPDRMYDDGRFVTSGFKAQAGSPLYPGILRSNLREGIWYAKQTYSPSTKAMVTSGGMSSTGVAQITTSKTHNISVGQSIVVFGAPPAFNGNYTVTSVPSNKTLVYQRDVEDGFLPITTSSFQSEYPLAQVMTVGDYVGLIPWDYLLSSVGVTDPESWVNAGNQSKKAV
jgi:hypothetical protein